MAATKVDHLFEKVTKLVKEIQLIDEKDHGLNGDEAWWFSLLTQEMADLWDEYLDRLIVEAAAEVRNPEELVFQADADLDELDRARERVRARLLERGVPLTPKKNLLN